MARLALHNIWLYPLPTTSLGIMRCTPPIDIAFELTPFCVPLLNEDRNSPGRRARIRDNTLTLSSVEVSLTVSPPLRTRNPSIVHLLNRDMSRESAHVHATRPLSALMVISQMLICFVGISVCFGWWSVKQERVVSQPYYKDVEKQTGQAMMSTLFGIGLCQTTTSTLIAIILITLSSARQCLIGRRSVQGGKKPRFSRKDIVELIQIGFSNAFGTSLGYAAIRRLSFPVVLSMKMSKMLPVMVVGFVWHRTRYSWGKVASCLLITTGVLVFYLQENQAAAKEGIRSSHLGLLLLVINLFLDGFTNSTQDVLVERHRWSGIRLMFWTNLMSSLWTVLLLLGLEYVEPALHAGAAALSEMEISAGSPLAAVVSAVVRALVQAPSWITVRDLSTTVEFLHAYPEAMYDMIHMSLLNALGQLFIFQAISLFGTLSLTAMTLLRKCGSVLLSIFIHGHKVQPLQWAALGVIFTGVVGEGYINVTDRTHHRPGKAARPSVKKTKKGKTAGGGQSTDKHGASGPTRKTGKKRRAQQEEGLIELHHDNRGQTVKKRQVAPTESA